MIKFDKFFNVEFPQKTKVKFNMNAGDAQVRAWDLLLEDSEDWIRINAWRSKKAKSNSFSDAEYVLTFAQYYPYGPNYYIFGGMYKVEEIIPAVYEEVGYKLTLMDDFLEYRKRLIVKLQKPIGQEMYNRWYENLQTGALCPEIYEIAPATKLGSFPGYSNVLLSHHDMQSIFKLESPEWKVALSNVKGVYCITDRSNGQLYIGSASGDSEGIWQRWSQYVNINNLTGGNKTFEELKENGTTHIIDNFSYSILEIFDMKTKKDYIIQREEYWKRVFQTVKYGMNN